MFTSYLDQSYLGEGSVPTAQAPMEMPPPMPLPRPASGLAGTVTLPGGVQVRTQTLLLIAAGLMALYLWKQRQ